MNILLINPEFLHAEIGHYNRNVEKQRGTYPSLGLAYIAAVLEQHGHQVKIIDCDVEENYEKKIDTVCQIFQPHLVGFYVMTWTYHQAKILAEQVKKNNSNIITVIGGPNVTCLPRYSLKCGEFDYGVYGEGEKTIIELVNKLENKSNLGFEDIKGLIFKKDRQIIINPPRPMIEDLDSIPFPARHLLPIKKYFDVFTRKKYFATLIATRGCPFDCIFCDRKNRMGKKWRVRSPENIAAEVKQIRDECHIKEFMFFDDNLIVDKKWGLELCQKLTPLNIIWECRTRVDLVDEELLKVMKEAGCYRIRFGFESGDNQILKVLKKGITVGQSLKTAEICKKIDIEMLGYFMIGSPTETSETVKKTIDLALKINPSFAIFSKTILIPGSELFDYGVTTNQINKGYWEKFLLGQEVDGAPSLSTKELPGKLVDEYIKKADRIFYFRPSFILKKLLATRSLGHLVRQTKMGLALLLK